MQLFGFNPSKCKTQCRLGVGRIKLLRNKKQIAMKQLRREVAQLLQQNKQGNARIRVEAVMREHRMLQAFEILELYLELLAVRAELLAKTREMPPDMVEAISSLIYAGERVSTDLAEVNAVAKLLVGKYSGVYKESGFPHEVVSDLTCRKWQVNDNLVTCLAVSAPLPEEKLAFLESIATEHDVEFDKDAAAMDMLPAAGKPLAVPPTAYAAPVETLAAGTGGGPLPLAQGWQPPTVAPEGGWGALSAGAAAGAVAGNSVWHRTGAAGSQPGPTAQPSAGQDGAGWQPPRPDDLDQQGRAFQQHVGATAAWRQGRLGTGAGPGAAGQSQGSDAAAGGYPSAAVGLAEFPDTAQSSGQSTPSVGDKPMTPGSSYADASAAADAAKRYSQMAQQAAQRAEEFATSQSKGGPGSPGAGSPGAPGSPPGGGGGASGSSGGGPSAKFVSRSLTEIQRAYDAAPGPPSKADKGAPAAPSAPPSAPPPAVSGAGTSASAATGGVAGGQELDASHMPSVPAATGVPPPPGVGDELDELTKRFERLKRG